MPVKDDLTLKMLIREITLVKLSIERNSEKLRQDKIKLKSLENKLQELTKVDQMDMFDYDDLDVMSELNG